jgi:hypothetical protein
VVDAFAYGRTIRDGDGRQVQTLVRELRHPAGRWPAITLAGVIHVGRPEYYAAVQCLLDAQSLVLFELVKKARQFLPFDPDATRQATCYTPEQRAAITRQNQYWLAVRLERFRRVHSRYPATLSELIASLPRGSSSIAMWTAVDGWGRDHLYVNQGSNFELTSLGSDGRPDGEGHAADIHFSDEVPLSDSEIRAVPLFERFAPALGLVPQSHHIDICRPHWVHCDRTIEELAAHAAQAEVTQANSQPYAVTEISFPAHAARAEGTQTNSQPYAATEISFPAYAARAEATQADSQSHAVAESSFARHRKLMSGDIESDIGMAALHRAISAVCLAISWSPGLKRAARLLLCEALDAASKDDSIACAASPGTILEFRNQLVVETLRRWIGDLPMPAGAGDGPQPDGTGVPASIGVLYGAMHMPGIEAGLRELGYVPFTDTWLTAIDVRPEPEAGRWDIFGRIAESLAARL